MSLSKIGFGAGLVLAGCEGPEMPTHSGDSLHLYPDTGALVDSGDSDTDSASDTGSGETGGETAAAFHTTTADDCRAILSEIAPENLDSGLSFADDVSQTPEYFADDAENPAASGHLENYYIYSPAPSEQTQFACGWMVADEGGARTPFGADLKSEANGAATAAIHMENVVTSTLEIWMGTLNEDLTFRAFAGDAPSQVTVLVNPHDGTVDAL